MHHQAIVQTEAAHHTIPGVQTLVMETAVAVRVHRVPSLEVVILAVQTVALVDPEVQVVEAVTDDSISFSNT